MSFLSAVIILAAMYTLAHTQSNEIESDEGVGWQNESEDSEDEEEDENEQMVGHVSGKPEGAPESLMPTEGFSEAESEDEPLFEEISNHLLGGIPLL